jgi:hypothetical protein
VYPRTTFEPLLDARPSRRRAGHDEAPPAHELAITSLRRQLGIVLIQLGRHITPGRPAVHLRYPAANR